MLGLRGAQLPHPQGDARRRPARAEKRLPQGTQAHAAQGIAEKIVGSGQWAVISEEAEGEIAQAVCLFFTDHCPLITDPCSEGCSSIGRAAVSKTAGSAFESLRPCC